MVLAIALEGIMVATFYTTGGLEGESVINRLAELFGGNIMADGYIQALNTWFFLGHIGDQSPVGREDRENAVEHRNID